MDKCFKEALELAANFYQLTDSCEIFRSSVESDGSGGVISNRYLQATEKCKVWNSLLNEKQSGGAINSYTEYKISLRKNADIQVADKIKIVGDSDYSRYFEVVSTNSANTDSVFLTIEVKERFD